MGNFFAESLRSPNYPSMIQAGANLPAFGQAAYSTTTAAIPELQSALTSILGAGYDPQNALFNQLQNQTAQSAAAANAMSGVSGPYAASTVNNALQNFGINWQNQQLGREAQAAQTANQLGGQIGNLGGMGLNQAIMGAQAGPQVLGGIAGLGSQIANLTAQSAGMPYQTSVGQSQNTLPILTALTNLGLQGLPSGQQTIADINSYLGLGQTASQNAVKSGTAGFNQDTQQLLGIGSLLGGALGGGGLTSPRFGSGGLTGALGLGNGGLVGSLFGPSDVLTPAAAGAASGFGNAFGAGALDLGFLPLAA